MGRTGSPQSGGAAFDPPSALEGGQEMTKAAKAAKAANDFSISLLDPN
jgi:hypothetical protein